MSSHYYSDNHSDKKEELERWQIFDRKERDEHQDGFCGDVDDDDDDRSSTPPIVGGWLESIVIQQDPYEIPHLPGESVVTWVDTDDCIETTTYSEDWHDAIVTWHSKPSPTYINPFYTHTQVQPSMIWEIVHNKKSVNFICSVYGDYSGILVPDNVAIIDLNRIAVMFLHPIAGKCVLAFDLNA